MIKRYKETQYKPASPTLSFMQLHRSSARWQAKTMISQMTFLFIKMSLSGIIQTNIFIKSFEILSDKMFKSYIFVYFILYMWF